MPNLSPNPSSIATEQQDAKRDSTQRYHQASLADEIQKPMEIAENNQDLFLGTEELLDALPKVWTRGILYSLLGFLVLALPWSIYAKIDETGSAKGRIEPKGATQKLDTEVGGTVTAVKVKEGDVVKAGQVLLEFDSEILRSHIQEARAKLIGLKNQRGQLEILKNQLQVTINIQQQQNQSQELEKLAKVSQARQDFEARKNSYNVEKLEKQASLTQVEQQIGVSQNDEQSAQSRLQIDTKQVERFNSLVADGAVSLKQVDELRKEEQESKRLYAKSKTDVKRAYLRLTEEANRYQASINKLDSDIKQANLRLQEEENSYQSLLKNGKLTILKNEQQLKDLQTQLTTNQSEIAQTTSQIQSLMLQLQQKVVISPTDGVIFEFPVSKSGAVLQPGQRVAQIAPKGVDFILNAQMPSQDSGFLKVGMPVKIKFDAYPFQEHGIIPGKVTKISPNSKINKTPQGEIDTFDLEITLEQQYIQNGDKPIPITAGQTANAEVIVRQRRVIDFAIEPFQKLQKGGLEI
jgi:hemolysin D